MTVIRKVIFNFLAFLGAVLLIGCVYLIVLGSYRYYQVKKEFKTQNPSAEILDVVGDGNPDAGQYLIKYTMPDNTEVQTETWIYKNYTGDWKVQKESETWR